MGRRPIDHPVPPGRWLPDLDAAVRALRDQGDAETVHQLRVALARSGVFLRIAGEKALAREVRWLRRLAGPLRDADVQLGLRGSRRGAAARQKQRQRVYAALLRHLERARARSLVAKLHAVEPMPPGRLERGLRRLARRALKRGARAQAPEADAARLHRLRRALRKARYAFELAGLPTSALTALQETLGEVQDLSLAHRPGRGHAARLARARARAQKQWPGVQKRLAAVA